MFYSSYFSGKNYFEGDGTQNYLMFQRVLKYFKEKLIVILFQYGNQNDCLMKGDIYS